MNSRTSPRPGGRSARVQAAVHRAVQDLMTEIDRADLTVPVIAERAGVTPSTIYRRWGNLPDLLSDVALERLQADTGPAETGTVLGDLQAWAEQYLDEMSSEPGRQMLRDVQCSATPGFCATIIGGQLQTILDRYPDQPLPSVDRLINLLAAPTVFRILFSNAPLTVQELHALIELALNA